MSTGEMRAYIYTGADRLGLKRKGGPITRSTKNEHKECECYIVAYRNTYIKDWKCKRWLERCWVHAFYSLSGRRTLEEGGGPVPLQTAPWLRSRKGKGDRDRRGDAKSPLRRSHPSHHQTAPGRKSKGRDNLGKAMGGGVLKRSGRKRRRQP